MRSFQADDKLASIEKYNVSYLKIIGIALNYTTLTINFKIALGYRNKIEYISKIKQNLVKINFKIVYLKQC